MVWGLLAIETCGLVYTTTATDRGSPNAVAAAEGFGIFVQYSLSVNL